MPLVNLGGVHSHPSNYTAWLALGATGIDTALMYGDDVQLKVGDAVQSSHTPRDELFITSKVPCCGAGDIGASWCRWHNAEYPDTDAYTRARIDLRLMGVDYVDLMLLHWPCESFEDTLRSYRALEKFALEGKARLIGISNFNASAIDRLYAAGLRVPPAVNQCGFSIGGHNRTETPLGRDDVTLEKCIERGITYSAYSPLGGLSGVDVLGNPVVKAVAAAHNRSTAQVALRWVTQQGIVAVTASTNPSHLKSDLQSLDFSLTKDQMRKLALV